MATNPKLKQLRQMKGLKLYHLAAHFEVDQSTIVRWEQVGPPRDRLPEVARFFDVTVEELMGW